jgi:cell division protein FtsB
LTRHKKQSKKCLTLQGKDNSAECVNCKKKFNIEYYKHHKIKCDKNIENIQEKNTILESQNKNLKTELEILNELLDKQKRECDDRLKEERIKWLESRLLQKNEPITENQDVILTVLQEKNERIKTLENKYLRTQKRHQYNDNNVIYLLTTEDHIKRRVYIIGKAKNLTNRLGTYNKTCDHTVIYYRKCPSLEKMSITETLVIEKLREYKEKANRERFILPEDKDVSFFTKIIDNCVDFVSE